MSNHQQVVPLSTVAELHINSQFPLTEDEQRVLDEVSHQTVQAIDHARLLAQTRERTRETERLFEVSRALVEANSLDDVYQLVIETVKANGVDRVSISLLDRAASGEIETVWIAATWDRDPEKQSPVGTRFSAKNFSLTHTFAQPPFTPLISEDLSSMEQVDPRMDENFRKFVHEELGMFTMFSSPMYLGNEYRGVLSMYTRTPHQYSQGEIQLYQLLSDQAIIVMENYTLLQSTLQERDRAAMLSELGQRLSQTSRLPEAVAEWRSSLPRTGASGGDLLLFESNGWQVCYSSIAERETQGEALQTVLGEITSLLLVTPEDTTWESFAPLFPAGATAVVWVPLRSSRTRLQGGLSFWQLQATPFSPNQIAAFEAITTQLRGTLENIRLLEQTAQALQETELLYEVSRRFNAAPTLTELVAPLMEALPGSFHDPHMAIDMIALSQPNQQGHGQVVVYWAAEQGEELVEAHGELGALQPYLARPVPELLSQEDLSPAEQQVVEQALGGRRRLLAVPLVVGQRTVGGLWLGSNAPQAHFSAGLQQQALTLAGQMAVVAQNLMLGEITRYNLYRTEILSQLSEGLLLADTPTAVYQACLEAIATTEPRRGAFIFMFDTFAPQGAETGMRLEALWDNSQTQALWPQLHLHSYFGAADIGLGRLVWTGEPVVMLDVAGSELLDETAQEALHLMHISRLVALPLWLRKEVSGFLLVADWQETAAEEGADEFATGPRVQLYEEIARRTSDALEYQRVFDEANYRARLLQTTAEISETATASLDLGQLLPQTVNLIRDRLGFYHAAIFLVNEYGNYAVVQAATGVVGETMLRLGHRLKVGGKSIVGSVTASGQAHIALDVGEDAVHFNNPLLPETRSEMGLPLIARGKVIGALNVQSRQAGAFTESDIAILQSMSNQLANAIEAAQAFRESQRALSEVSKLHDFYLREEWGGYLREQRGTHSIAYQQGQWHPLTGLPKGLQPHVAGLQGARLINQTIGEQAEGLTVLAPLMLNGQASIGTVALAVDEADDTGEDTLAIISAVAAQAAQAIEAARLFEQTQSAREEAEALYKVVRRLVTIRDEQEMFHTILRELFLALGIDQGGIMLLDEASVVTLAEGGDGTLMSRSVALVIQGEPVAREPEMTAKYHHIFDYFRAERRPLMVAAAQEDTRLEPLWRQLARFNIASMLVVPLVINQRVVGAVRAEVTGLAYEFSEREVNLALAMVDQLAIAMQNHRLLAETKRRAVQLQTSAEVSRVATSILEQETMLDEAVRLIRERFGYHHVQIFLNDELQQYTVLRHATGDAGAQLLSLGHKVAMGSHNVVGQVSEFGGSLVMREASLGQGGRVDESLGRWGVQWRTAEDGEAVVPRASLNGERGLQTEFVPGASAELCVALKVGQKVLGVVDVQSEDVEAFSPEETATLETLASQLAIAVQNARQFREQQETAQRLREVDKLKTQFLANMSHELRTPLNSIIGFSRVILKGIDGPLTDLQKADLTSIHNSGQHLLGLINNMLDLSKIEAGKMELHLEEVEIEPIIKQVMSTALALVKDKPVKLITKVEDDIPHVWADPTRVRQVVLNLVSNASKFTEEGEIVVRAFANETKVTVSVTDSGIGIPAEKLGSVFEEFTQVDSSTTRKVGGTGLGLPISRHFVEMHKGQIWVESEPGMGSTFSFAIPIKPPEGTEEGDAAAASMPAEGSMKEKETKKTVVAIDADPNVVALYKRFLTRDYEVIGINNSDNVVAKVKHYAPFAVLLDVLLAGTDGWSVLSELKENSVTQAIPIVICSTVKDKNRGFSLGASDYLVKPIVENELVRALRNIESLEREKTKVLIIDDHADDVLLIRRMLEVEEHYKVIEANDGREGLKIVLSMQPDLIICDLMMPEINGFRVVEQLKANAATRDIPVIIVSAQELSAAEQRYLDQHAEFVLRKGIFTERELLEDVTDILERLRARG